MDVVEWWGMSEVVASIFVRPSGQVTLTWCPAGPVQLQDWPTVDDARRSVDDAWHDLTWEEVAPNEWVAREAS
jgi:hypothetical protein